MEERIAMMRDDPAVGLTVDANAIAGLLEVVFGREITTMEERCAHCGTTSVVGTLRVYMRGPGVVVRCPACEEVLLRVSHDGDSRYWLEMTGVRSLEVRL